MIAQWEYECISLSVLSMAQVMIAQWEYECNSDVAEVLGDFSLADHTRPIRSEPTWQKMAQSLLYGATQPVDSMEEGRSPAMSKQ